jgi:hypothetical protein
MAFASVVWALLLVFQAGVGSHHPEIDSTSMPGGSTAPPPLAAPQIDLANTPLAPMTSIRGQVGDGSNAPTTPHHGRHTGRHTVSPAPDDSVDEPAPDGLAVGAILTPPTALAALESRASARPLTDHSILESLTAREFPGRAPPTATA